MFDIHGVYGGGENDDTNEVLVAILMLLFISVKEGQ